MAIKFDVEEKEKQKKELQEQENRLAKVQNRKAKKIKVKTEKESTFERWSDALLPLNIIALVYAISYTFSGFIILIPTLILWTIWLIVVLLPTVLTLGAVWFSKDFNSFIGGFTNFNNSVSNGSTAIIDFMYRIFPYVASFFALCVSTYLILKIVGAKKQLGKSYKGKLIWAIILTVLYVVAITFDIIAYVNL